MPDYPKALIYTANSAAVLSVLALGTLVFSIPALFCVIHEMDTDLDLRRTEMADLSKKMWDDLKGQQGEIRRARRQNYEEKGDVASAGEASTTTGPKPAPQLDESCPAGPKGAPGADGIPGPDGPDGVPGQSGENGGNEQMDGPGGACADCPVGPPGLPGYKGKRGPRGEKGAPGPQGPAGRDGEHGDLGPDGEPGLPGQLGVTGEKGPAGEDGVGGAKGAPGPKGPVGPPGMEGDEGLPGERGDDGEHGTQGEPGPMGEAGLPGREGYPGHPGTAGGTGKDAEYCPCPERNRKGSQPAADAYDETVAGDDANVEAPGFGPKDYSEPSSTESSSQEPEKPYAEQAPVRVSKREQARNLRRKLVI